MCSIIYKLEVCNTNNNNLPDWGIEIYTRNWNYFTKCKIYMLNTRWHWFRLDIYQTAKLRQNINWMLICTHVVMNMILISYINYMWI